MGSKNSSSNTGPGGLQMGFGMDPTGQNYLGSGMPSGSAMSGANGMIDPTTGKPFNSNPMTNLGMQNNQSTLGGIANFGTPTPSLTTGSGNTQPGMPGMPGSTPPSGMNPVPPAGFTPSWQQAGFNNFNDWSNALNQQKQMQGAQAGIDLPPGFGILNNGTMPPDGMQNRLAFQQPPSGQNPVPVGGPQSGNINFGGGNFSRTVNLNNGATGRFVGTDANGQPVYVNNYDPYANISPDGITNAHAVMNYTDANGNSVSSPANQYNPAPQDFIFDMFPPSGMNPGFNPLQGPTGIRVVQPGDNQSSSNVPTPILPPTPMPPSGMAPMPIARPAPMPIAQPQPQPPVRAPAPTLVRKLAPVMGKGPGSRAPTLMPARATGARRVS